MSLSKNCVGVVFGGMSGEHNVSIKSAITVITALQSKKNKLHFNVIPFYIDLKGRWWPANIAKLALNIEQALQEKALPSPLPHPGFKGLPESAEKIDVWFPVLHGPNGEDGTVQGLFKLMGKPFVGSGVLGSALGMDKLAMKAAFHAAGLPQVAYTSANTQELTTDASLEKVINRIENEIPYPCFIKPANLGSSVGITKANHRVQLIEGLKLAGNFDKRIVIEEAVIARELECGVLGKSKLQVSTVGEVKFSCDWFDYDTKYSKEDSHSIIPAKIPEETIERVQILTLQAFKAISANGIARVDFFYDERNNELWINEINTLPGFTSQSMYPSLWNASGVTLEELVAQLVETAGE